MSPPCYAVDHRRLPKFSLITISAFVVVGLFMAFARRGREIYAVGGGRGEALAAGVSSTVPIVIVFVLFGLLIVFSQSSAVAPFIYTLF